MPPIHIAIAMEAIVTGESKLTQGPPPQSRRRSVAGNRSTTLGCCEAFRNPTRPAHRRVQATMQVDRSHGRPRRYRAQLWCRAEPPTRLSRSAKEVQEAVAARSHAGESCRKARRHADTSDRRRSHAEGSRPYWPRACRQLVRTEL